MNKAQFLEAVRRNLSALPPQDIEASLQYCGEMIDDAVEEGRSEEEAVASLAPPEEIAAQILASTPLSRREAESSRPRRPLRGWEIVLLILGSPVWLPLCLAALAVLLAVFAVLAAAVLTLYAADLTLAVGAIVGIFTGFLLLFRGSVVQALLLAGAGLFCTGGAILLFFVCHAAARLVWWSVRRILRGIKSCFVGGNMR